MTRERWHLAYFVDVFWRIWRLGRRNLIPTGVLKQKSTIDARCWSRSKMMNFEQSWNAAFSLSNLNNWCHWDATRRRKWAKTLEFIAFGRSCLNQVRGLFLVPRILLQNAFHIVAVFAYSADVLRKVWRFGPLKGKHFCCFIMVLMRFRENRFSTFWGRAGDDTWAFAFAWFCCRFLKILTSGTQELDSHLGF